MCNWHETTMFIHKGPVNKLDITSASQSLYHSPGYKIIVHKLDITSASESVPLPWL